MDKLDIVAIAVLFVVAFSLWTLPLQSDSRPFGEGDSAWHFSVGDYIGSSDRPIWRIPFYIGQWYYNYNPALGPNAPEYPPSNHYNYALMQVVGGERFVPVIMYRAMASFLGVFAVYFLVRKLYGMPAALIASSGLLFSVREYMIYLWGQQPTLVSVVFAPVTFYAYYRYLTSYYSGEKKPAYLYVTALLLCSQYLLHIQGFTLSMAVLGAFTVMMSVKYRKLPFLREGKLHLAVVAVLMLAVILPFIMIYLGTPQQVPGGPDFSRLFSWGVEHSLVAGSYPPAFVEFSAEYPKFFLPLILLGVLFLLIKRRSSDILMLSWLFGVYFMLHADIFLGVSVERSARMLISEPSLFYSLIGIGAVSLFSFVPLPSVFRAVCKYAVAGVIISILVFSTGVAAKDALSNSYTSIFRITPPQLGLSDWARSSLPENAYLYYMPDSQGFKIGNWQYAKMRWMLAASQRHFSSFPGVFANNSDVAGSPFYFVFDYSDLAVILSSPPNPFQQSAQQSANALQQFEIARFNGTQPLYNRDNIRVYEVDAEAFR